MWIGVIQLLLAVVAIWAFRALFTDGPFSTSGGGIIDGSLIGVGDGNVLSFQLVVALIALGLYLLSVILHLFNWVRGIDADAPTAGNGQAR